MIRTFALISLFLFQLNGSLFSQQKDFVSWNYLNLTYKINENWSASLTEHMMRNENVSEWWLFLHDLSVNHRITRHLSHELHLRLINQKKLNDQFEDREMLFYALNARYTWRGWSVSARSRWQGLIYGGRIRDAAKGPYYYHRFRMGISKSVNYHWRTGMNAELFQPLNRPQRAPVDQFRLSSSITYRLNRYLSIDNIFQIQQQLNRSNPYTYYVWGLGCNYTW